MCPICLANAALIAAGATSSGGVTAFVVSRFWRRKNNQTKGETNKSTEGKFIWPTQKAEKQ
jgi:hypothetical protein